MKKRLLLIGVTLLFSITVVMAVPAKPGTKKTVRQADGTLIELTLRGDEHYSFYTAEDGTPYQLKAGAQLLKMTNEEVSARWTELREQRLAADSRRANARTKSPKQAGTPGQTTGKHRGLIILVEFKDVKFASVDVQATFNRFFNEEGYNEYGNTGSVKDYFLKQSYGQLEIDFDVYGPYTTGGTLAAYGAAADGYNDINPTAMVMEALDQAAKEVDFSNYDWDNDGEVDQVFIICAGYDQAEGADPDYIWPHEWALEAQGISRTYNGKRINTYGVATELWGDGKKNNLDKEIAGIGTACHEFSHCLGLPDFYDTQGDNFGMSYWSVMSAGNYLNNSHTPAGYTSYERMFAGWLEPVELNDMTRIEGMKPLATKPECYVLYNEANRNEFYLLENRQKVDFDASLFGHGLLILHVDYSDGVWLSNSVNNNAERQRMTIIPADNQLFESPSSLAGDPFPGMNNTSLTNYTTPASTTYNANTDGQKLMSKPVDNITESADGLISFVACRPELAVPEPDGGTEVEGEASFTISWPAVSGAISYELEVTEIGTAADNPEEALTREYTFDKFYSKTAGFSDVSSKLPDYGLSGWSGSKLFTTPNKMRLGTSSTSGYVRTPYWRVPQSSELTIVMGADVVKADNPVKGTLTVYYGNEGDMTASQESVSFEVTDGTCQVFHFAIRKDLFCIEISPLSQMYLNYLAVYDGTWSAVQLGIETPASVRVQTPRKAMTVKTYTAETNSITLTDLNRSSRYIYKVRALGEENTYSAWSDEKTFTFNGVSGIDVLSNSSACEGIYDLNGRSLGTYPATFRRGVYIIGGKKVVK